MSIENRPEFIAATIQLKADGWTPERLEDRETYRSRVMAFIAGLATCSQVEKPMADIGMDDEAVS